MRKKWMLIIAAMLAVSLLAGCAGTTVVVQMPMDTVAAPGANESAAITGEGAVKTGLAVITQVSDSTSAVDGQEGTIQYDITLAAVTVDDNGVILSAQIDSVPASVTMDAHGSITSELRARIATKNELGADYGMVAYGGAVAEWDAQVAALCTYAIGKTVDELKNGAIDETGRAPAGTDLASSATIYLGGYVRAIEAAAQNAQHLGAQAGDELALVTLNSLESSAAATAEKNGVAQLDVSIAVVTSKDGVITSCLLDGLQAKVSFDEAGSITSDLKADFPTKNQLGEGYGMKAYGGAVAEWNKQAASFASYVTGKTAEEVAGIAVNEQNVTTEADLASSVTIKIGDFQKLIAKALGV